MKRPLAKTADMHFHLRKIVLAKTPSLNPNLQYCWSWQSWQLYFIDAVTSLYWKSSALAAIKSCVRIFFSKLRHFLNRVLFLFLTAAAIFYVNPGCCRDFFVLSAVSMWYEKIGSDEGHVRYFLWDSTELRMYQYWETVMQSTFNLNRQGLEKKRIKWFAQNRIVC